MAKRVLVLVVAGCAVVAVAAARPVVARADSGCREQGRSTIYKLTKARRRALKRKFLRSHHGYRFVTMGTSIFAPPHYVGIYWLKGRGPGGTWAAGGVTDYCNGRLIKHPVHNGLVGFDVTGFFIIESHGTGAYSDVKTVTDPGAGDTTTYAKTVNFQWDNVYGTAKKPVPIQINTTEQTITGGMPADALRFTMSGTASYQVTDSLDPSQDFTCTYSIGGAPQAEFGWNKARHNGGLLFQESLTAPPLTLLSNSSPDQSCDDPNPGDPAQENGGLLLAFHVPILPPGKESGGAAVWKSFSVSPGFNHTSHSDTTDPDSGLRYVEDRDLNLSAGTQFQLRRVRPPSD